VLHITRNNDGSVVIVDTRTGKSEALSTNITGRPVAKAVKPTTELPAFAWDRRSA
jgi:hypothetical protein